jgi:hypothetical protein
MDKPKEIWVFSTINPEITGPFTVTGEACDGICWSYDNANGNSCIVIKSQTGFSRKQAVEACYKYHEGLIKQERKRLNERKRLLKKFYSEELYG